MEGGALGYSRAQVQDAYGKPKSCQSGEVGGDLAFCAHRVDGGGHVWVRYRGADGDQPSNSPDDVAYFVYWEEPVRGWTTTAGVNTALARANPDAVIAAYPNGVVKYDMLGSILQVRDYELGIQVGCDLGRPSLRRGQQRAERERPGQIAAGRRRQAGMAITRNKTSEVFLRPVRARSSFAPLPERATSASEKPRRSGSGTPRGDLQLPFSCPLVSVSRPFSSR